MGTALIDLTNPKVVTRWKNCVPTRTTAVPTPFGQERAEAIFQAAKQRPCWAENLDDNMTDGEIAYVKAVWDTLDGGSCFWDALNSIRLGLINEPNQKG